MNVNSKELIKYLVKGDISSLSRAITIVESKAMKHKIIASELISLSKSKIKKQTIRVGISGMPGAGKSTFINSLGMHLISQGLKVAVLAVDPSSTISKGSILGDKTRMEDLIKEERAFIRPTASGGYLGGTANKTRDVITLCEAAGYDVILVETVGIGQSETEVKTMVDIFLLLILPAGGDELQGIKKGAVELADLIIINKADADKLKIARRTKVEYKQAARILGQSNKFAEKVVLSSALNNVGIDKIWAMIYKYSSSETYIEQIKKIRQEQEIYWIEKSFNEAIITAVLTDQEVKSRSEELKKQILNNKISIDFAVEEIIKLL